MATQLHRRPARHGRKQTYPAYRSYGTDVREGSRPIVLYLRLSKYHADGADAIERQRLDLQRKLDREGLWTIVGEYIDNDSASSAAIRERQGWKQLNEAIASGAVTAVAFWKLDRTNRVAARMIEWLGSCRERGVTLVSHEDSDDELNNASANAKLLTGIKALFAEIETDTMSVRQKAAHEHLAQAGFYNGGNPPFGWIAGDRLVNEDGVSGRPLIPHPIEYPAVQEAVGMVLEGRSLAEIRDHWANVHGIVTSTGRPLNIGNIRRYLTAPAMVGYRVQRAPEFERGVKRDRLAYVVRDSKGVPLVAHEPACSVSDWNAVRTALEERNTRGRGYTPWGSGGEWILTGLLRCPGCGRGLYGSLRSSVLADGTRVRGRRYVCRSNARYGKGSCPGGRMIEADAAEGYVKAWLFALLTPERLTAARARLASQVQQQSSDTEKSDLQDALAEREVLVARQKAGDFRGSMLAIYMDLLEDVTSRIDRLRTTEGEAAPVAVPAFTGDELSSKWSSLSLAQKRQILGRVIDRIEVAAGDGSPDERLRVIEADR